MRKGFLIAVAITCLIGVIISAVSTTQYFRIQKQGLEEKSFCAISKVIDCDIANASSYSTIAQIPVAWFGLMTYVLIGGLAVLGAISKKEQRASVTFAWFLSILAVLYSIRMAYILVYVLQIICIECVGMYVINLFAAIGLLLALRIPMKNLGRFFADYVRAVLGRPSNLNFAPRFVLHVVVALVIFTLGSAVMYNMQDATAKTRITLKEKLDAHYMQSLYITTPRAGWPVWGDGDDKVSIIEFSDFECPFCRHAAFNLRPYLHEFKKDVRYYYVNYPLDQMCNPYIEYPMHKSACLAAFAAECALSYGDFWDFHDDLFRNQRKLSREVILKFAEKRGWNTDEFGQCMDSAETKKKVLDDIEIGRRSHISGTPTIIVNGRHLKYWMDPKFLQAVVKEEIKRANSSPK